AKPPGEKNRGCDARGRRVDGKDVPDWPCRCPAGRPTVDRRPIRSRRCRTPSGGEDPELTGLAAYFGIMLGSATTRWSGVVANDNEKNVIDTQSPREPGKAEVGDGRTPVIVAIGASAGGIFALQSFFGALPENTGAAYVVVVHLDPAHRSEMPS